MECAGVYDRKYQELYYDGNSGCTTAKKLWEDSRKESNRSNVKITNINCTCCTTYKTWARKHTLDAQKLKEQAKIPVHYRVYANKTVKVVVDEKEVAYIGTIHSVNCSGNALSNGSHPYQCSHCYSLVHGNNSSLLRKFNHAKSLKYPRSHSARATKIGVVHKYCSVSQIESALHVKSVRAKMGKDKLEKINVKLQNMLSDNWHKSDTAIPFLKSLHSLIVDNKLSDFDISFITNWVGKKAKGQYYRADLQARSLAVLYCNRLGQKTYNELSPILGLPCLRQAQRTKRKLLEEQMFMPGINEWALEMVAEREKRPLQNSMDGTRIIRAVELYAETYLVGEEFPTDVRCYPDSADLPTFQGAKEVFEYISKVRTNDLYAAEAYSIDFVDTTGKMNDMLIGSIPEAKNGVTGLHIFALMMQVENRSSKYALPLIGHCTDSASNSLRALVTLATPKSYQQLQRKVRFIGLPMTGFAYYAPILHKGYPSIAYPCWDHCGRTSIRNLMNANISIVTEVIPPASNTTPDCIKYSTATIQDLRALKRLNPNSSVKYADITPHVRHNCDAAVRVL